MGPSVGWNSLLIELFGLNCAQMAPGRTFPAGLELTSLVLKQIFLTFSVSLERFRFTFMANGKRNFVPRVEFFLNLCFTVHYLYIKISSFTLVLSKIIVLGCFSDTLSILESLSFTSPANVRFKLRISQNRK